MTGDHKQSDPHFLGIEGGGTRTVALLADAGGNLIGRVEAGPANLRLLDDTQLVDHFRELAKLFPAASAIGIGLAGMRTERDRERVLKATRAAWPNRPCTVSNDLEIILIAANRVGTPKQQTRVVILSGTGSCVYGRDPAGKTSKIGGWGHLIGDKGSGFEIGLRALKAVVYYFDRDGRWPKLGQRILRALQLNEPDEIIGWIQRAEKRAVAALAVEVFGAWAEGDRIARDILEAAAASLAKDGVDCAKHLAKPGAPVQFILAGSVLLRQPRFAKMVARRIVQLWPRATVTPLKSESVWGAVELAKEAYDKGSMEAVKTGGVNVRAVPKQKTTLRSPRTPVQPMPPLARSLSTTELRNPRSRNLHKLSLSKAIALMLDEEAHVAAAILAERGKIERAIRLIVRALRKGGRLFYIGAGTSGRLGVLDAAECPPTFRTSPDQIQAIIAGGHQALWSSIEGAEDDAAAGARAIQFRGVTQKDVVIGIAASGQTPFVWGALAEAKRRRAKTILLCFNPSLKIAKSERPNIVIAPAVGPEVLTGSTRLKAGTATKIILNLFTTLSMVQLGKVVSNLMVDLNPSNTKLRDRAVRIVQELNGCDYATSEKALRESKWLVKEALEILTRRR